MKDKMIKHIVNSLKDLSHLERFFKDTDDFYNTFDEMTSEAGRLIVSKRLVKATGDIKNEFVKTTDRLEKMFNEVKFELREHYNNQANILSTLANQRLITNTLTNQLLKITEALDSGNLSKESVSKILETGREYIAQCTRCNATVTAPMNELMKLPDCPNCPKVNQKFEEYILVTRVSY